MNSASLSQPVNFGAGAQVLLLQAANQALIRLVAQRADNSCPSDADPVSSRAGAIRRASLRLRSSLVATVSKLSGIGRSGHPERHRRSVEVRQHGLP